MNRRQLLRTAAFGSLAVAPRTFAQTKDSGARPAASDRIRVGLIGVGSFGRTNQRDFLANPDVDIVAACDVFKPNLDESLATIEKAGGKAKGHNDYRRLLDDKSIDAVVITTPEHWHALMTIDACNAGKDVYVEKPASHNIADGSLMVEAARRNKRVVQVGTQQRSGAHFQRAVRYVQEGRLGDVHYATCWNHTPTREPKPPITGGPPPGMDWDMWLGPAPKVPYAEVISVGRRGYWDFWGGMNCEWGAHLVDIILWAMKAKSPQVVAAAGGRFFKKQGELPDTLQVTYKFPKFLFHYSVLNHNTYGLNGDLGAARFGSYGMQFQGTKGTLFIDRGGFRLTPQPIRHEEADQPPPRATTDSRQPGFYYTSDLKSEISDSSEQHGPHVRNFLDCVKSRQRSIADIEDGHAANTVCRLGNIAYRVGRTLHWDATRERVKNDAQANRLVVGTYRAPWKLKGISS